MQTCRIIQKEAGHLPLVLNKLNFNGPLNAISFFGFGCPPTVSHLVKKVTIEFEINPFQINRFEVDVWKFVVVEELERMKIEHLKLVIKGELRRGPMGELVGEKEFVGRLMKLRGVLKGLDVTFGSHLLGEEDKKLCERSVREQVLGQVEGVDGV